MGKALRRPRLAIPVGLALLAAAFVTAPIAQAGSTSAVQTYVVLYQQTASSAGAAALVQSAGGTVVANYTDIGVVIARSDSAAFASTVGAAAGVEGVSATGGFATRLNDDQVADASGPPPGDPSGAPATDSDTLSGLQWDMRQIHTPEAHAITGGSPSVLVGDIDTGVDFSHPDLAANLDVANSVNCVGGAPVAGLAAQDDNGHGTHTAGTIAAASNGIGIVGVAPNVHLAAIKAGDADGYFYPEAVVCAFVWAGTHGVDVTNNSYFADPWLFNCKNDPGQRAIWKAEQRAIRFAIQRGTTVVAAEGNQADDLAHPTMDSTSPDNTTAVQRTVHNDCAVVPVEVPGVIGVTGDGNAQAADGGYLKSFYSSFGVGSAQVVAPGGDSVLGRTAAAPNGRVLSTWPSYKACTRKVLEGTTVYCYLQGTSMATPHVAGVAALVISQFGHQSSPNGNLSPGQVAAFLEGTADAQACPTATEQAMYAFFPAVDNGAAQACSGGAAYNSWYGHGQVNALRAVTNSR